ncbi:hypothetical protein C8R48DRAFT_778520 [Suillus tomentosus]|nr:hypothetical protein C8R48DRAFT_778520 [Suillus tomentosus]
MESPIRSPFSGLPVEIATIIFEYAAEPTFSQREKYDDKTPYSTALSLCLVSRLVRRIVLPELLHTILLRRRYDVKKFVNALLMQKAYAQKQSDLFFDYTSAVQRMWISDFFDHSPNAQRAMVNHFFLRHPLQEPEFELDMSVLVPVILAAPALAIDVYHLKLIVQSVEDAWTSRADANIDHEHSPFPSKTQNLTIIRHSSNWKIFENIPKGCAFLAPITQLTFLTDLDEESNTFRDISRGLKSPELSLCDWMKDIPWARMKSLEAVSAAYPHMAAPFSMRSYIDPTRGLDLHVERLTVSAPLYRQDPQFFPWATPPFSITDPGKKRVESDGLSFEVTRDQTHFCRFFCSWDRAWASGLTDG